MKKKTLRTLFNLALAVCGMQSAHAQSTAFTYQGRLDDSGHPVNGLYDMFFGIYDAASGGTQLPAGNPAGLGFPAVPVTNGLFTLTLDFQNESAAIFNGARRWLQIEVRTNNSPAGYIGLSPRTELTATPYAIYAQKAGSVTNGAIGSAQLAPASVGSNQVANYSINGAKIANGTVVRSLNGLKDDVTLSAGANITLTPSANNSIEISSTGDGAFSRNGTSAYYNSGNVGIGTANPGAPLHVNGAEEGIRIQGPRTGPSGVAYMSFADSVGTLMGYVGDGSLGDNNLFLGSYLGDVVLNTPAGRVLTATASGNVGIGTSTPQNLLHLNSATSSPYIILDKPSVSYEAGIAFRTGGSPSWWAFTDNGSDDFKIEAAFESDANPRIRLPYANRDVLLGLSGGNVGIGVTDPSYQLDLGGGSVRLRTGPIFVGPPPLPTGVWFQARHSSGVNGKADIGVIGALDATRIGFYGNDPRGRLGWGLTFDTLTGNVGIGTGTGYPTDKLHVNGSARVASLTITGGADLAEPFQMSSTSIPKGSLVIIDEENPGKLKLSDGAYDTRVAGIVSGANGIKPGISLHQEGALEGTDNVALSGRVYALADASSASIKPGDLLTSSDTPGHCMKVTDSTKAQGAIIGKAMSALDSGKGMVLVLVSLQ